MYSLGVLLFLVLCTQITDSVERSWQEIMAMEKQKYMKKYRRQNKDLNPYKGLKNMTTDYMFAKEAGAIIQMTQEFIRDMDMKMRDVYRVEKRYVRTFDFGAGKLYHQLESIFEHMVHLYRNTTNYDKLYGYGVDLRSDIVGSLQFMLSDYMEFITMVEQYKERYRLFKQHSRTWEIRAMVQDVLTKNKIYPRGTRPAVSLDSDCCK
ncbi:uncharacterized protein LOC125238812 [Leguminivora glycinivorella]|uniref:uncharacterized protein LOC125238812 n=1 Tax=Leguminivora glycinivorella TaxID=1035111 RepID=UPI0020105B60|nr:uncharacterized protein LOC125238812 [Leguminivora glycinivorella]